MLSVSQMYSFFDRAGFLTDAVWNGTITVRGDFRSGYEDMLGVGTTVPVFSVPKDEMPLVSAGDTLDIGADRYIVAEVNRPGHDDDMRLILQLA